MKALVVVEDDQDMRLLISLILQRDDRIDVRGACATAGEAIDAAREVQPELVILDHFIDGDVMGLDAAPSIREVAPRARILLFTSHDLALEAAREPAIDRFLPKRDIALLLPAVQELLGLDAVHA